MIYNENGVTKKKKIRVRYFIVQKDWYRNMNNLVRNYWHRGEENDLYLCHMSLPKMDIDRLGYYPRCWRWKSHNIEREW